MKQNMTSRERVNLTLNHKQPDKVPLDLGGSGVTSMHVSSVYLLRQAFTAFQDQDLEIARTVISNIEDDGYLSASAEEIADEGFDLDDVKRIIKRLQRFDPVGCAWRDKKEPLFVQLEVLGCGPDSVECILVRDYLRKYSGVVVSCIMVAGGMIGLLLFAPFSSSLGWGRSLTFFNSLTVTGWLLVLYLGIVTVGLGYYWLYIGLSRTGVSSGMMIFFVKPALVALLAHFLQGQPLSIWIGLGIILAAASVFVVGMAGRTG